MSNEVKSLGEALPSEMKRVREQLMSKYQAIGGAGAFAIAMMNNELDRATKALAEGDVVKMLQSYEALKEFTS